MPDEEPTDGQPSLELPSLGGWRRRRRSRETEPAAGPTAGPVSGGLGSVREPQTEPEPPPPATALAPLADPVGGEQATIVRPESVADAPPSRARWIRITPHQPGGYLAALGAGAVIGLLMVGLTWGSLQTCEQVQGTSSCGTAGYPMLLSVLVLAVVLGGLLLRLLRVPDPGSTSFLGTGLTTVLSLLFLVDRLDSPAMVAVVPVLTAACFAAAHWVTATFIEPGGR